MACRVVWSPAALSDVEAIAEFIATDSPAYARAVVKRMMNLSRNLAQFPNSGRQVPEFHDDKIRELFAYSYRIIYRVESDTVLITAVIHGKRDLG